MQILSKEEKIRQLIELEQLEYAKAEKNFYTFFQVGWRIIEPNTKLLTNWHHQLIAEYLTACQRRQIKRLIINIPPRYAKSSLSTILFPVWSWLQNPSETFMFASYNYTLSIRHSDDRRVIINSPWFLDKWGDRFKIDKDTTEYVQNDRQGHFISTSLEGSATGMGANILVIDDPHDVEKAQSDKIREREVKIFHNKLYNRLNDKTNGVIIIIMQRCHESDLTGDLLKGQEKYEHLKIPAVCEQGRKIIFPLSGKSFERKEGDILHPEREDNQKIEEHKQKGSYYFSSQYQQNPSPIEGGIIKVKWFQYYNKLPDKFDFVLDSWDLSVKDKTTSDFACGIVWGIKGALKYILHLHKQQMGFSDSLRIMLGIRAKYPGISKTIIEDKANGSPVIEILKQKVSGIIPYNPQLDKIARLRICEPDFEAGQVLLPVKELATFDTEEYVSNLTKFPNITHDDDVDATTTGLIYIRTELKAVSVDFF